MKTEYMPAEGDLRSHNALVQADRAVNLFPTPVEHFPHPLPIPQFADMKLVTLHAFGQVLRVDHHSQPGQEILLAI